jgi:hypothetical protein
MALIDDIEFYGRAVDAGEMDRDVAARLLAEASGGGLTVRGAAQSIGDWYGLRDRMRSMYADTVDALRALENGRPIPAHVLSNSRRRMRDSLLRRNGDPDDRPAA